MSGLHTFITSALLPLVTDASGESWWQTIIGWFRDPAGLLISMGPWVLAGVALIVFVESGVLFPLLPGDSLIFAAGLLHISLGINMWVLIGVILFAAFLGAQVGYWLGHKWGRSLFKDDARILKTQYLVQAEHFFDRYGGRALVIGRFVPFVRTYVPLAAGMARFNYGKFVFYNTLGALLWGGGVTWLGAALGGVDFIHDNLSIIVILIVFVSVIPMVVEWLLQRRKATKAAAASGSEGKEQAHEGGRHAAGADAVKGSHLAEAEATAAASASAHSLGAPVLGRHSANAQVPGKHAGPGTQAAARGEAES